MRLAKDKQSPSSPDIYNSWSVIKQLEQQAVFCASRHDWLSTQQACISRRKHLDSHFTKYPVSPETAFFYRHYLSEHLRDEKTMGQLHNIATRKSLRLVK